MGCPRERMPRKPRGSTASRTTASHLFRNRRGQLRPCGSQRRASVRGTMNGQAMQKTLPAASNPRTTRPRQ